MDGFVMHAAPSEEETAPSALKWPEDVAVQRTEEFEFQLGLTRPSMKPTLCCPITPEMNTVGQIAKDASRSLFSLYTQERS